MTIEAAVAEGTTATDVNTELEPWLRGREPVLGTRVLLGIWR